MSSNIKLSYPMIFEIQGNNGGDYIKVGKLGPGDNRIFLEIGHCCVLIFRGIVTAEMLTSFFASAKMESNKPLIETMAEKMQWEKEANDRFCIGAKNLGRFDKIS